MGSFCLFKGVPLISSYFGCWMQIHHCDINVESGPSLNFLNLIFPQYVNLHISNICYNHIPLIKIYIIFNKTLITIIIFSPTIFYTFLVPCLKSINVLLDINLNILSLLNLQYFQTVSPFIGSLKFLLSHAYYFKLHHYL